MFPAQVRGIKIAPEGTRCASCWNELTEEDRRLGSSYASLEFYSVAMGESHSMTLWFCLECAKKGGLAMHSAVGTSIVHDAVEGSVRTLVRMSNELNPFQARDKK